MSESIITKKALSEGLKELMKHKSFSKISIADITQQCGLNRQTFYYHFQDKYELLNWIYYNEAIVPLTVDLTFDTWGRKLLEMLRTMKRESYFYENALKSPGGNEFESYLLSFSRELAGSIFKKLDTEHRITEEDIEFYAKFFSFGIVGMIVLWAKTGMNETPERMIDGFKDLVYDSKMFAVKRYFDTQEANTDAQNQSILNP